MVGAECSVQCRVVVVECYYGTSRLIRVGTHCYRNSQIVTLQCHRRGIGIYLVQLQTCGQGGDGERVAGGVVKLSGECCTRDVGLVCLHRALHTVNGQCKVSPNVLHRVGEVYIAIARLQACLQTVAGKGCKFLPTEREMRKGVLCGVGVGECYVSRK